MCWHIIDPAGSGIRFLPVNPEENNREEIEMRQPRLIICLFVIGLLLGACNAIPPEETPGSNETKTQKTKQTETEADPAREPDVEDISRHPSDLPRSPRYTLYEDGEAKNPVTRTDEPITIEVHFKIREVIAEIVKGTTRELWTFNGTVPGPMIRGRVGDTIDFYLHNPGESGFPHNVDFHAVTGPGGGSVELDTLPGEISHLRARLLAPGIYVYHCAFPPIPNHIEHGMYGLVVVEPRGGLPEVDQEYYLMQHEYYTELGGDQSAARTKDKGHLSPSAKHGHLEEPTYVAFNGRPGAISGDRALGRFNTTIETGDTARFYVGNIGPNLISSFHIIGEIFSKVFVEGSFDLVNRHVQSTLVPAGGAVGVEVTFEVPGDYTPVDHAIYRTDKGAIGNIHVTGPKNEEVYDPVRSSDIRGAGYE